MNLGQMTDSVYRQLQDTTRTFVKEADVHDWLNDALLDIDARLRFTRLEYTGTTDGTNAITLPNGTVEVLSLYLSGLTDPVLFSSDADWGFASANAESLPISLGRVFNGVIEVYPTPDNATAYTLRIVAEPTTLSGNSDTPTLPSAVHAKLVAYAAAQALYSDGNFALGDRKMQQFSDGLPGPPTGLVKLQPGPLTISFEPGPFDVADATHI